MNKGEEIFNYFFSEAFWFVLMGYLLFKAVQCCKKLNVGDFDISVSYPFQNTDSINGFTVW
jgi:hypothetical protein